MSQPPKVKVWMRYGHVGRAAMARKSLGSLSTDPTIPASIQLQAHSISRQLLELETRLRTELNTKLDAKGNPRR